MTLKNILLTALLASSATLSAHATTMENSSQDELTKVVYSCEKKQTLEVVFVNTTKNAYAIINQADEMIPMINIPSASGSLYKAINKNYTYELYTKGNNAQLLGDNGTEILSKCVNQ